MKICRHCGSLFKLAAHTQKKNSHLCSVRLTNLHDGNERERLSGYGDGMRDTMRGWLNFSVKMKVIA